MIHFFNRTRNRRAGPICLALSLLSAGLAALPATPLAAAPLRVVVCASHHHVLPYWYRAARKGELPRTGLTVVHLDAHPDLAVPARPIPDGFPRLDGSHQDGIDIASFQLAAVRAGLVDRVLWVRPAWAPQIPDGEHRFRLGAGVDGYLRVDSPLDYYVLNGVWAPGVALNATRELSLRVLQLDPAPGDGLLVPAGRPYILDIDLDIFSTRNPAVDNLRDAGFSAEEIATIRRVFARENLDLDENPAERQRDLAAIEAAIQTVTGGDWYEIPGAALRLWWYGISPGELYELFDLLDGKSYQQIDVLVSQGRTAVGVPVHKSEQAEIEAALAALEGLTSRRLERPALVTIARSMKDGFTHPFWLGPVETGVLEVLEKTHGPLRVTYDADLKALD